MKKYTVFAAILSCLALVSCNTEEHSGKIEKCHTGYKACSNDILLTCADGEIEYQVCTTDKPNAKGACIDNECSFECTGGYIKDNNDACVPANICTKTSDSCVDGQLQKCVEGKTPELINCKDDNKICANQKCVECTEDNMTYCEVKEHAKKSCKDFTCQFECNDDYIKSSDGKSCVKCEPNDVSKCEVPENGNAKCSAITTCDSNNENCHFQNTCDFECNEGFVKNLTSSTQKCEPFVCDDNTLDNCLENVPDHAKPTCHSNQCEFECDLGYVKSNNGQCVQCTPDNTSQCHFENAASVSCKDNNTCDFECNNCYIKGVDKCELRSDVGDSCIKIDCNNDPKAICINTADEFINLPKMLTPEGEVTVDGKDADAVFYLMNDINLADASIFNDASDCSVWNPLEKIKGLNLKTENDLVKQISFNTQSNEKLNNCKLPEGLFTTLTNSSISNIRISLDIEGPNAQAALAQTIDNTTLTNITFTGSVNNTTKSGFEPNVAGIVGTAMNNSTLTDVICSGVSVYGKGMKHETLSSDDPPKNILNEGSYVAGVIGFLENSTYTMTNNKNNTIKDISTNHIGSGFIGRAANSIIKDVIQKTERINQICDTTNEELHCDVVNNAGYASGFVHIVQGGTIENIDNSVSDYVQGENVSGFVDSAISVQSQSSLSFTNIKNNINKLFCNNESGEAIKFKNIAAGFGLHLENIELKKITNNINTLNGSTNGLYVSGFANTLYHCTVDEITNSIIGTINAQSYAFGFANSITNSPVTNVKNDINILKGQNVAGFGYNINFKDIFDTTDSDLSNIINTIQKIETSNSTAGFVHTSTYSRFSTIKNQIINISSNTIGTPSNSVGGFAYSANSSIFEKIDNTIGKVESKELGGFAYESHSSIYNKIYNEIKKDWSGTNFGGFVFNDISKNKCSDCYAEYNDIQNLINGIITPSGNGGGFIETINFSSDYTKSLKISKIINTVKSMTSSAASSTSSSAGGFINNIHKSSPSENLWENNLSVEIENIDSKVNLNLTNHPISGFITSSNPITKISNVKSIATLTSNKEIIGFANIVGFHELVPGSTNYNYLPTIEFKDVYSQASITTNSSDTASGLFSISSDINYYNNTNTDNYKKAYSNLNLKAFNIVSVVGIYKPNNDSSSQPSVNEVIYNNLISSDCKRFDTLKTLCQGSNLCKNSSSPTFSNICYLPITENETTSACKSDYRGIVNFNKCSTDNRPFGDNWSLENLPSFESDQAEITTNTKVPMITPEAPDMSWLDDFNKKNDDNTSEPSPIN